MAKGNNDLQSITQETKDRRTRTPLTFQLVLNLSYLQGNKNIGIFCLFCCLIYKKNIYWFIEEKPQFIKRPVKELKVAENTNVNLTCQTSGKPDPIITWYKERQQITGGRYQILPNGDLYITVI